MARLLLSFLFRGRRRLAVPVCFFLRVLSACLSSTWRFSLASCRCTLGRSHLPARRHRGPRIFGPSTRPCLPPRRRRDRQRTPQDARARELLVQRHGLLLLFRRLLGLARVAVERDGPGFVVVVVVAAALRRSRREVRPAPALRRRRRRGPRPRRRRGDLFSITQSALVRVGLAPFQGLLALDPGLGLAPGHLRLAF